MSACDHKFVDSTRCLKCGWEPPPKQEAQPSQPLVAALAQRERSYRDALEQLENAVENDDQAYAATCELREAVYTIRCLTRLLEGRSVDEIHRAFGAPGDFGYETPIGDALARVYGLRT